MKVVWKNNTPENSPILSAREAGWDDFYVKQLRVAPGEMPEHNYTHHGINLTTVGHIFTKRHTSSGKTREDLGTTETMCLMPAGQTVCAEWKGEYESVMVDFTPKYLSRMAHEMNFAGNIELKDTVSKKDELIQNLSLAFLAEGNQKESSSILYTDSIVHTLMFHLIKNYTTATIRTKQFLGGLSGYKLRRVTEFINDNLDQDLSLTKIAGVADLSHFHFARAFRRTLGLTPQQYIINRRIEKAKDLLAHSNLPIVEVGFQAGFKNQSHFTTLFRKLTSFSPKMWRESKQA